jgi:hypothetical protein
LGTIFVQRCGPAPLPPSPNGSPPRLCGAPFPNCHRFDARQVRLELEELGATVVANPSWSKPGAGKADRPGGEEGGWADEPIVVSCREDQKLVNARRAGRDVVIRAWVSKCYEELREMPLEPQWMASTSARLREEFAARFDAFGDSFADAVGEKDVRTLIDEQVNQQVWDEAHSEGELGPEEEADLEDDLRRDEASADADAGGGSGIADRPVWSLFRGLAAVCVEPPCGEDGEGTLPFLASANVIPHRLPRIILVLPFATDYWNQRLSTDRPHYSSRESGGWRWRARFGWRQQDGWRDDIVQLRS